MKRKFLSLACALALMLTLFTVPTSAAEQIYDTDYDLLEVNGEDYEFYLEIQGSYGLTTGKSSGPKIMDCSMSVTTSSGVYWASGEDDYNMSASSSGHGVIHSSRSNCGVANHNVRTVLIVE